MAPLMRKHKMTAFVVDFSGILSLLFTAVPIICDKPLNTKTICHYSLHEIYCTWLV